jgi:hypothetical protein
MLLWGCKNRPIFRKGLPMFASILLLAASAVSVEFGYEPLPDGGMKYIVQFDPQSLEEAQQQGVPIESNIPADVTGVRMVAIQLGSGRLPRENPPANADQLPGGIAVPRNVDAPPLLQTPQGKPLATEASFNEPKERRKADKGSAEPGTSSTVATLSKPWPLVGIALALAASLGGNFYLGMILAESRKRCRALLAR